MFTGIIKNIGIIKELKDKNNGYFLSVISDLSFTKKDIDEAINDHTREATSWDQTPDKVAYLKKAGKFINKFTRLICI